MKAVLILLFALAFASPARAGWRADCRHANRLCRTTHAVSITTTTIPTVTYYCHDRQANPVPVTCFKVQRPSLGLSGDAEDIFCSGFDLFHSCGFSLSAS